ncbi:hypothetical protein WA026_001272 [Henosepilachna vigintioctopunctata]|uniref:Uncharacterized protein n=1 Tax=Henosepilachna vigintioctopunctata TaxID=420089 RepID=A0AAW1USW0_9CUCU
MSSARRFTRQDLHNFSFGSSYCLENPRCSEEFEEFLKNTKRTSYIPTLKLFNKACHSRNYNEEEFSDLFDQIDDFNTHELSRHNSDQQKLDCIKIQCSDIFDKGVYKLFIPFLKDEKMKTKH